MSSLAPPRSVTIKLTDNQYRWLMNASRFLEGETGCDVTPSSLILHLVEYGLPGFEAELTKIRARGNAEAKRFSELQIAL